MPKIVDHNEFRQKILEKSLSCFSRKGYSNVNMKQIAAEIGVSTGTLYYYFPSKEKILTEMTTWISDKNMTEGIQRTASINNISDRFDALVAFCREKGELYQNIVLLAIDVYRNIDASQWKELYAYFFDVCVKAIQDRLNISADFAQTIFIYFIGLSCHSLAFPEIKEYDKHIDLMETVFRPLIVDANGDREQASEKFKEIFSTMLMNHVENTDAKRTKKKRAKPLLGKKRDLKKRTLTETRRGYEADKRHKSNAMS